MTTPEENREAAREAITRGRARHREVGCCCPLPLLAIVRRDDGEFSVTFGHAEWCPLPRSQEGPTG